MAHFWFHPRGEILIVPAKITMKCCGIWEFNCINWYAFSDVIILFETLEDIWLFLLPTHEPILAWVPRQGLGWLRWRCVTRRSLFLALEILKHLSLQVFEFSHFHFLADIITDQEYSGLFLITLDVIKLTNSIERPLLLRYLFSFPEFDTLNKRISPESKNGYKSQHVSRALTIILIVSFRLSIMP
jgi:hypothetical protein